MALYACQCLQAESVVHSYEKVMLKYIDKINDLYKFEIILN